MANHNILCENLERSELNAFFYVRKPYCATTLTKRQSCTLRTTPHRCSTFFLSNCTRGCGPGGPEKTRAPGPGPGPGNFVRPGPYLRVPEGPGIGFHKMRSPDIDITS